MDLLTAKDEEEGVIEEPINRRRIYNGRRRHHSEEAKESDDPFLSGNTPVRHNPLAMTKSLNESAVATYLPTGVPNQDLPNPLKSESKYDSKEDDSAEEEESKHRDTPRNEEEGGGSLVSPSLRSSRSIQYSSRLSATTPIDNIDRKASPMLTSSSILRKPEDKLKKRFSHRLRRSSDDIPEVHFIGEISEGVGFKGAYVSCKWYIEWGKSWSLLEGEGLSQTQYTASNVWNHPIDVHFAATSMLEWPRIIVQVWTLDSYGRSMLAGYGFTHLPTNPGEHELEINCWKPTNGTIREKLEELFLGKTPSRLLDESVIFGTAWENRSRLTTVSTGKIKLNVTAVLRFFHDHNVK
mmetsp:Transcript_3490/g.5314  ORF Transcript_3490/g.5314 Transcript_3490/m.5314 type:complete len:352 (-) Transcript_3490:3-1058(-)